MYAYIRSKLARAYGRPFQKAIVNWHEYAFFRKAILKTPFRPRPREIHSFTNCHLVVIADVDSKQEEKSSNGRDWRLFSSRGDPGRLNARIIQLIDSRYDR
jgi:hypothetical protein